MTTYAFRTLAGDLYLSAPEFGRPTPVHAQIAQAQREAERARDATPEAVRRRLAARELVTDVGNPAPYTGPLVPTNARKIADAARVAGFEVRVLEFDDGCRVEGLHRERREGFRAGYERGRASSASWHTPYRYTIVRDERPVKMAALTRTGLKGYRTEGTGTTRLALLGRPQGMKITHTELLTRLVESRP